MKYASHKIFFLIIFLGHGLCATESQFPVDISLLVADLKYNEEQGVKICEIQQVSISLLYGYDFVFGGEGTMVELICNVLSQYHNDFWFIPKSINFPLARVQFAHHGWQEAPTMLALFRDKNFLEKATCPPSDPHVISDYHVILYTRYLPLHRLNAYREKYPGVIWINAANWPYWNDKYLMNQLLRGHPVLEKIRPRWNLYPKEYSPKLAKQIQKEIKSDMFVIKPRGTAEGRGIIIVKKEDLDPTLRYILTTEKDILRQHPDRAYYYWGWDLFDTFLVEEFVASDPIEIHGLPVNATVRTVFALVYDHNQIKFHFIGGFWLLPKKSLLDEGTLTEIHKCYPYVPNFSEVAPDTLEKVKQQLSEAMPLMYEKMLTSRP